MDGARVDSWVEFTVFQYTGENARANMPEPNIHSEREQAHRLLDALPDDKISAVRNLLAVMLDPVSRAISNAPYDDEPECDSEREAVARSKAWLAEHPSEGFPLEEVMAELRVPPKDNRR